MELDKVWRYHYVHAGYFLNSRKDTFLLHYRSIERCKSTLTTFSLSLLFLFLLVLPYDLEDSTTKKKEKRVNPVIPGSAFVKTIKKYLSFGSKETRGNIARWSKLRNRQHLTYIAKCCAVEIRTLVSQHLAAPLPSRAAALSSDNGSVHNAADSTEKTSVMCDRFFRRDVAAAEIQRNREKKKRKDISRSTVCVFHWLNYPIVFNRRPKRQIPREFTRDTRFNAKHFQRHYLLFKLTQISTDFC